jgi:hypothetical protein
LIVYLLSALVQLVRLSWWQDRYELAKSAQQPQQVATPSCACKSVRLEAPAATVSFIWRSVMALHRQTYMAFPLCIWFVLQIKMIMDFIIVIKWWIAMMDAVRIFIWIRIKPTGEVGFMLFENRI